MAWSIGVVANTVQISPTCAQELFEKQGGESGEVWSSFEDVTYEGKITFNPDHMEWMDWLGDSEELVEILKKHRVYGDICFGSLEGNNAGEFWGYRFDGQGGMKELIGRVVYEERRTPFKNMVFVITGAINGMTREELSEKIRELGGEVSDSVSGKVTHLIVGVKPGSKLAKAKKLGIIILTEEQFLVLLAK